MDKKNCLGLNRQFKADIEIVDYENLFVGLEFEFNIMRDRPSSRAYRMNDNGDAEVIDTSTADGQVNQVKDGGARMKEISEHFEVDDGKTNGRGRKKSKVALANGGVIEVPMDVDLYDDNKIVTQVYQDGCTDYEVVTRPVGLKLLKDVKSEVFDYLKKEFKVDFVCDGKSGLHMTFLLDHHKERSKWNKNVVQNLMQYARCYYEELIQLGRVNDFTRSLEYRKLFDMVNMEECSGAHYNCITCRKGSGGDIWGIEIRFPDSCDSWDKILKVIKFWMGMIRHCAIISKYGRITFDQSIWDKQKSWYDSNNESMKIEKKNCSRIPQLAKQIKDSLIYYGVEIKDGLIAGKVSEEKDELMSCIWEMKLAGENYDNIRNKMIEKGYDQKMIYKVCKVEGIK